MFKNLSHVTLYVNQLDEALAFYTEKLGFDVRSDTLFEGFRWLTVGVPGQPELELVLMEPKAGPMIKEEHASMLRELMAAGVMGTGVFTSTDVKADYERLVAKGVEFMSPPQERPYGIEALFKDCSGNWFSLTQPYA